jgi:chemotaxis signal transduction protein
MTSPGRAGALHIVACVGDERFAFPVADVEEAVDAPRIEWVPVAPDGMLGQLAHRGRMVGAWDAARIFRLARPAGGGAALVLRDGPHRMALVVDDVLDVVRIGEATLREAPAGADPDGVLSGVCLRTDRGQRGGDDALLSVVRVDALAALVSQRGTLVEGMTR